jgi:hypothetical protein
MPQQKWFLDGFGGMTWLQSFKSQAPRVKEVPSPKPQRADLDGHHIARALVWSLRIGASLELGAWSFAARRIPKQRRTTKVKGVQQGAGSSGQISGCGLPSSSFGLRLRSHPVSCAWLVNQSLRPSKNGLQS